MLALLVCALALSVSVPLRTYLSQQEAVSQQRQRQQQLSEQVGQLEAREAQLSDPVQREAEIRRRLGYVRPGETPYVVQVPPRPDPSGSATQQQRPTGPAWYEDLWNSISGKGP